MMSAAVQMQLSWQHLTGMLQHSHPGRWAGHHKLYRQHSLGYTSIRMIMSNEALVNFPHSSQGARQTTAHLIPDNLLQYLNPTAFSGILSFFTDFIDSHV